MQIFLWFTLVFLLFHCNGQCETGFLSNGSFEEYNRVSVISKWQPWASFNQPIDPSKVSFVVDPAIFRGGKGSLKIEARDGKRYGCSQTLDAGTLCRKSGLNSLDGATLKLCGYIKSAVKGAGLAVDFCGKNASCQTSQPGDTANGWTRHTIEWVLTEGTQSITVHCIFNGSGTAWFDDLSLAITSSGKGTAGTCKDLLENTGFEESSEKEIPTGWNTGDGTAVVGLDREVKHHGQSSLKVSGAGYTRIIRNMDTKDIPKGEELVLTGFVKVNGNLTSFVNIQLQCRMPGNKASEVESGGINGSTDWKELKTHMVVPKDCEQVEVGLYFCSKDATTMAWIDDLQLRKPQPGEKLERVFASQKLDGPGLACAEGCYELSEEALAGGVKIAFPIPQMYEEQVPFYAEFCTQPEGAIQKVTLKQRVEAPPNCIAEVEFKPLKGKKIQFNWKGYVLLGIHDYDSLPKTVKIPAKNDLPRDILPWLKSTKSVQAGDRAIMKKAQELRTPDADCIQTIRNVLKCSAETVQKEIKPDKPDTSAARTLEYGGGECTSAANLAAALLRAAGIPARVLANYPNWNTPFQTHYFVEAYVPGYGWARGESIMDRFPVQSYENVIVSVVYPGDEDGSFRTENRVNGMGADGCPWLSLTEPLNSYSSFGLAWNGCDHVGIPVMEFKATKKEMDTVLELTRKVWTACLEHDVGGKPVKEALDLQKKACEARSLKEFKDLMQKACEVYGR